MIEGNNEYWIRGTDEHQVRRLLAEAGILPILNPGWAVAMIGTLVIDEQPIEGWHANLKTAESLTVEQMRVLAPILIPEPKHPMVVWS
jgi:hypothetical protein